MAFIYISWAVDRLAHFSYGGFMKKITRGPSGKKAVRGFKHTPTSNVSGYLKTGRNFFPSHAPIWWSYTSAFNGDSEHNQGFATVGEIVKTKLEGKDGTRMSSYRQGWQNSNLINQIKAIQKAAEKEEQAFLHKYKISIAPNQWGTLIEFFTVAFSSEESFKRNLQLLKQVRDGESPIYHDFTAYLSGYVQKAARDIIDKHKEELIDRPLNEVLPNVNDQIIELALNRMFKMTDLRLSNGYIETHSQKQKSLQGEEIQAFQYLIQEIKMFMNSPFKQLVIDDLGLTQQFLEDTVAAKLQNRGRKGGKLNKLPVLKSSITNGNVRGSVREHFVTVFASQAAEKLNMQIGNNTLWAIIEVGKQGAKPDVLGHNLQATATGHIPDISLLFSTAGSDDSNRVNAINNSETFFKHLRDAEGDIIFVSDKNYQITQGFEGYSVQRNIKLKNLAALLQKVGYQGGDLEQLFAYLSNCGQKMLLSPADASGVLTEVATYVGHFLFDDLTITGGISGVNRVHLLDLSGFYMPLSVYMGALLQAAETAQERTAKDMDGFVHLAFTGKGNPPQEKGWSGKGDFDTFRNTRLAESEVEVKIMQDITEFILKFFTITV